jgi:hypothetical protein
MRPGDLAQRRWRSPAFSAVRARAGRSPNNERAVQEEAISGGRGARVRNCASRRPARSARRPDFGQRRLDLASARRRRLVTFPMKSVRGASLRVFQTREAELTGSTIVGTVDLQARRVHHLLASSAGSWWESRGRTSNRGARRGRKNNRTSHVDVVRVRDVTHSENG